jgi:hypothetical protein
MEQHNSPKRDSPARQYPTTESISVDQMGKIAEPIAAYIHAPSQGITPTRRFIAGISAAEPVWRFAVANELIPYLETAVRLVHESFQKVDGLQFDYEIDPEIENESWIVVRAKVDGELDELINEYTNFNKAMVRAVPIDKQAFIRFSPESELLFASTKAKSTRKSVFSNNIFFYKHFAPNGAKKFFQFH